MPKKQPCSVMMPGVDPILDPRERQQFVERKTHRLMLADILLLLGRRRRARCRAGSAMRTHCPTKSDISVGELSSERADAAAHGVAKDHDLAHLEQPNGEFDRGAYSVRLVVGAIGRHDIGDVADDEEFAGPGIENHLRIGAAVRTGNDQRARPLSEPAQGLETVAFGLPGAGAETAIAFDQIVHCVSQAPCGFRYKRFVQAIRTRYNAKQEGYLWETRDIMTELTVYSTIGVRSAAEAIFAQFEKETGHHLAVTWGTAPMLVKRVEDGETADVLILSRAGIDALRKGGKVAPGSEVHAGGFRGRDRGQGRRAKAGYFNAGGIEEDASCCKIDRL